MNFDQTRAQLSETSRKTRFIVLLLIRSTRSLKETIFSTGPLASKEEKTANLDQRRPRSAISCPPNPSSILCLLFFRGIHSQIHSF